MAVAKSLLELRTDRQRGVVAVAFRGLLCVSQKCSLEDFTAFPSAASSLSLPVSPRQDANYPYPWTVSQERQKAGSPTGCSNRLALQNRDVTLHLAERQRNNRVAENCSGA